jgi:small subunit ribosomal protein S14
VAKMALIERELKRDKLVAKYAKKHAELKALPTTPSAATKSAPQPAWRCRSCRATQTRPVSATAANHGPSPWHVPHFGLARAKIREMAFAGEIPGVTKASW